MYSHFFPATREFSSSRSLSFSTSEGGEAMAPVPKRIPLGSYFLHADTSDHGKSRLPKKERPPSAAEYVSSLERRARSVMMSGEAVSMGRVGCRERHTHSCSRGIQSRPRRP